MFFQGPTCLEGEKQYNHNNHNQSQCPGFRHLPCKKKIYTINIASNDFRRKYNVLNEKRDNLFSDRHTVVDEGYSRT